MVQLTVQQAFDLAVQHHQAGRLQQAEQLYRQVLTQQPTHPGALHLLGVIAHQVGRHDIAVSLIGQAIALKPDYADAHNNLGNALSRQGHLEQAIPAFRRAISLDPSTVEAYDNLSSALSRQGRLNEALQVCRQAIAVRSDHAESHNNLGNVLSQQGHLDEAVAAFRQAVALQPAYAEAHNNLGNALRTLGQSAPAMAAFRQAIAVKPDYAEAYNNLGVSLRNEGQLEDAIAAFRQAIALNPNYAEVHYNLGYALGDRERLDEAIAAYRQAIAIKSDLPVAHMNLGSALKDTGQLEEAIAAYRQAIAVDPNYVEAHSNLLIALNYADVDGPAVAQELGRWNRQHAEPLRKFVQPHPNDRDPERRLRIGYVSADLWAHASACFLVPLLENHDPRQLELFAYAQVPRPDSVTSRLQKSFAQYRSTVGLSDEQVATQIRDDRIDILVDLKLHTADNRLLVFARKPAPVQVTWLGYPGSTGMGVMDYRLSDSHLDPPGMDESVYSEKTIRLADSFWCYEPLDGRDIAVSTPPAMSSGFITFGCLNNFCKINDAVLRAWAKILGAVPSSRLLLLAPEGNCRQRALQLLEQDGVAPARIEFISRRPRRSYLELYQQIDLGLDTFPCSGHTTSMDSFWMGVPVVTLVGPTAMGRAGVCQLMNLNLPELIAKTPEQYVQIAVALATDRARLADLRGTLRRRMEQSPLMDGRRFAADIESAYRQMWRNWCA